VLFTQYHLDDRQVTDCNRVFDINLLKYGESEMSFNSLRASRPLRAGFLLRMIASTVCNSGFYLWIIFTIPSILIRNDTGMSLIGSAFGIVFLATLDDTDTPFAASGAYHLADGSGDLLSASALKYEGSSTGGLRDQLHEPLVQKKVQRAKSPL
jgi:hypothetical protein